MKSLPVSVIIPTYNRCELLEYTLQSLMSQSFSKDEFEVIICDDGSSDGTFNLVEKYRSELDIKYYYQQNKGFRAALTRNMGIKLAKGEICILLDSGLIASSNFINEHYLLHKENKNAVGIGYVYGFEIEEKDEQILKDMIDCKNIDQTFDNISKNLDFVDRREQDIYQISQNLNDLPAPWINFWTCNVSVSKDNLFSVGLFDETYITWGGEDTDLAIRLFLKKMNFHFLGKGCAIHYPHEKEKSKIEDKEEKTTTRKMQLFKKYYLELSKIYGQESQSIWLNVESKKINQALVDLKNGR